MKLKIIFFLVLAIQVQATAQISSLTLVCANSPTIDGTVRPGEWNDADTLRVAVGSNKSVRVSFKRDLENMYFLFSGNLESRFLFPEILFDVDNSKSNTWQSDDWWFHISATDCENLGAYGVYANCLLVQPDWAAVNNITQGQPITDTVEVSIPFSKIGFIASETNSVFGLSFVLNDFGSGNYIWPPAADESNPSTWGEMKIESPTCNMTHLKEINSRYGIGLYPVPSSGKFTLDFKDDGSKVYKFQISHVTGNTLPFESKLVSGKIEFEFEGEPGIYVLNVLESDQLVQTFKLIIY